MLPWPEPGVPEVAVFRPFSWDLSNFGGVVMCCYTAFGGYWVLNVHHAYQRVKGTPAIRGWKKSKGVRRIRI